MTKLTRMQTAIGVLGAALLILLVIDPRLVPLPATVSTVDLPSAEIVGLGVAAVLAFATAMVALSVEGRSPTDDADVLVANDPEDIHGRSTGYPRPNVDQRFDQLEDGEHEPVADLSADLRETVVRLYAASDGRSRDEAAAMVEDGGWTDDMRAAAFVAEDADPLSLRTRLWDYIRPEDSYHRRARRAVEAMESLVANEPATESPGGDE